MYVLRSLSMPHNKNKRSKNTIDQKFGDVKSAVHDNNRHRLRKGSDLLLLSEGLRFAAEFLFENWLQNA